MTELLSYDEDAKEAAISVKIISTHDSPEVREIDPSCAWPICGDELTKRGMK